MNTLLLCFSILQAAGAMIGAGGAIFSEIFYIRALEDGAIDKAERAHLLVIAKGLRWGMGILLAGSIGLVLTNFIYDVPVQPALTTSYWIEMALVLTIIYFTWALARGVVRFLIGSAAVFTGWWFLALLVFGRLPSMSFGSAVALYLVATGIVIALLSYARMMTSRVS